MLGSAATLGVMLVKSVSFWVDESRCHTGIASRLLRAAEEAASRGCRKIVLSTHSFQAPDFFSNVEPLT